MDLSSVVPNSTPPRFVNNQLVSLPPVGILNKNFCSICICICFIYTAPQACSFKYKPCINKVALPFFYLFSILVYGSRNESTCLPPNWLGFNFGPVPYLCGVCSWFLPWSRGFSPCTPFLLPPQKFQFNQDRGSA